MSDISNRSDLISQLRVALPPEEFKKINFGELSDAQLHAKLNEALTKNKNWGKFDDIEITMSAQNEQALTTEETVSFYKNEAGDEVTEKRQGETLLEKVIKHADENGKVIEIVISYQDGKPVRKSRKEDGKLVETLLKHPDGTGVILDYSSENIKKITVNAMNDDFEWEDENILNSETIEYKKMDDYDEVTAYTELNKVLAYMIKPQQYKLDYDKTKLKELFAQLGRPDCEYEMISDNPLTYAIKYDDGSISQTIQVADAPESIEYGSSLRSTTGSREYILSMAQKDDPRNKYYHFNPDGSFKYMVITDDRSKGKTTTVYPNGNLEQSVYKNNKKTQSVLYNQKGEQISSKMYSYDNNGRISETVTFYTENAPEPSLANMRVVADASGNMYYHKPDKDGEYKELAQMRVCDSIPVLNDKNEIIGYQPVTAMTVDANGMVQQTNLYNRASLRENLASGEHYDFSEIDNQARETAIETMIQALTTTIEMLETKEEGKSWIDASTWVNKICELCGGGRLEAIKTLKSKVKELESLRSQTVIKTIHNDGKEDETAIKKLTNNNEKLEENFKFKYADITGRIYDDKERDKYIKYNQEIQKLSSNLKTLYENYKKDGSLTENEKAIFSKILGKNEFKDVDFQAFINQAEANKDEEGNPSFMSTEVAGKKYSELTKELLKQSEVQRAINVISGNDENIEGFGQVIDLVGMCFEFKGIAWGLGKLWKGATAVAKLGKTEKIANAMTKAGKWYNREGKVAEFTRFTTQNLMLRPTVGGINFATYDMLHEGFRQAYANEEFNLSKVGSHGMTGFATGYLAGTGSALVGEQLMKLFKSPEGEKIIEAVEKGMKKGHSKDKLIADLMEAQADKGFMAKSVGFLSEAATFGFASSVVNLFDGSEIRENIKHNNYQHLSDEKIDNMSKTELMKNMLYMQGVDTEGMSDSEVYMAYAKNEYANQFTGLGKLKIAERVVGMFLTKGHAPGAKLGLRVKNLELKPDEYGQYHYKGKPVSAEEITGLINHAMAFDVLESRLQNEFNKYGQAPMSGRQFAEMTYGKPKDGEVVPKIDFADNIKIGIKDGGYEVTTVDGIIKKVATIEEVLEIHSEAIFIDGAYQKYPDKDKISLSEFAQKLRKEIGSTTNNKYPSLSEIDKFARDEENNEANLIKRRFKDVKSKQAQFQVGSYLDVLLSTIPEDSPEVEITDISIMKDYILPDGTVISRRYAGDTGKLIFNEKTQTHEVPEVKDRVLFWIKDVNGKEHMLPALSKENLAKARKLLNYMATQNPIKNNSKKDIEQAQQARLSGMSGISPQQHVKGQVVSQSANEYGLPTEVFEACKLADGIVSEKLITNAQKFLQAGMPVEKVIQFMNALKPKTQPTETIVTRENSIQPDKTPDEFESEIRTSGMYSDYDISELKKLYTEFGSIVEDFATRTIDKNGKKEPMFTAIDLELTLRAKNSDFRTKILEVKKLEGNDYVYKFSLDDMKHANKAIDRHPQKSEVEKFIIDKLINNDDIDSTKLRIFVDTLTPNTKVEDMEILKSILVDKQIPDNAKKSVIIDYMSLGPKEQTEIKREHSENPNVTASEIMLKVKGGQFSVKEENPVDIMTLIKDTPELSDLPEYAISEIKEGYTPSQFKEELENLKLYLKKHPNANSNTKTNLLLMRSVYLDKGLDIDVKKIVENDLLDSFNLLYSVMEVPGMVLPGEKQFIKLLAMSKINIDNPEIFKKNYRYILSNKIKNPNEIADIMRHNIDYAQRQNELNGYALDESTSSVLQYTENISDMSGILRMLNNISSHTGKIENPNAIADLLNKAGITDFKAFDEYIENIDMEQLYKVAPRMKKFSDKELLTFYAYHFQNNTKTFDNSTLAFTKDFTNFLATHYIDAENMGELLSAFPNIDRNVGALPQSWGAKPELASQINSVIDRFRVSRDNSELENSLSKILGKTVTVETMDSGVFGTGYKIEVEGSEPVVLKLFHEKPLGNVYHPLDGQQAETQAGIFLNNNSNQFVHMYFGRISGEHDKDGFLVTQFIGDGVEPIITSGNNKDYKIDPKDVDDRGHNKINGTIIDFGRVVVTKTDGSDASFGLFKGGDFAKIKKEYVAPQLKIGSLETQADTMASDISSEDSMKRTKGNLGTESEERFSKSELEELKKLSAKYPVTERFMKAFGLGGQNGLTLEFKFGFDEIKERVEVFNKIQNKFGISENALFTLLKDSDVCDVKQLFKSIKSKSDVRAIELLSGDIGNAKVKTPDDYKFDVHDLQQIFETEGRKTKNFDKLVEYLIKEDVLSFTNIIGNNKGKLRDSILSQVKTDADVSNMIDIISRSKQISTKFNIKIGIDSYKIAADNFKTQEEKDLFFQYVNKPEYTHSDYKEANRGVLIALASCESVDVKDLIKFVMGELNNTNLTLEHKSDILTNLAEFDNIDWGIAEKVLKTLKSDNPHDITLNTILNKGMTSDIEYALKLDKGDSVNSNITEYVTKNEAVPYDAKALTEIEPKTELEKSVLNLLLDSNKDKRFEALAIKDIMEAVKTQEDFDQLKTLLKDETKDTFDIIKILKEKTDNSWMDNFTIPEISEEVFEDHVSNMLGNLADLRGVKDSSEVIQPEHVSNLYKLSSHRKKKLVDSGLFSLIGKGKISPSILKNITETTFLSNRTLRDIAKIRDGKTSVETLPTGTKLSDIAKFVEEGEVCEIDGKLYANDGGKAMEVKLSKQTFERLFPPLSSVTFEQGALGNCYFVSTLDNCMDMSWGRTQIYKMFEEKGDDVYIKFPQRGIRKLVYGNRQIKFPKGQVIDNNGQQISGTDKTFGNSPLGILMVEQAYAVHRLKTEDTSIKENKYSWFSNTYDMSKCTDIEGLMDRLEGGSQVDVIKDIFGKDITVLHYGVDLENREQMKKTIIETANDPNTMTFFGTRNIKGGDREYLSKKYGIAGNHAYAIKGYNKDTGMVYITNPWHTSVITEIPLYELMKYMQYVNIAKRNVN